MLGQSDVVVIGLPLTKATRHLFTRDLSGACGGTPSSSTSPAARIVFGDDLLAALDEGLIGAPASTSPIPSPCRRTIASGRTRGPIVTPHTAGGSPRRAHRVIATFCENLRRMRAGQPFLALIDKHKGY